MAAARKLVERILRALERGNNVVVHCWGGLGRAGTIAASCLVARGCLPAKAIALVRSTRGRDPDGASGAVRQRARCIARDAGTRAIAEVTIVMALWRMERDGTQVRLTMSITRRHPSPRFRPAARPKRP